MTTEKRKRLKREKTNEPNLYRQGDVYYFRKGDFERSLGPHSTEKAAVEYKRIFEAKRDTVGALAYKFRAKDVFPDYAGERESQASGEIHGRRTLSPRTVKETDDIWRVHLRPFFGNKKLSEIDTQLWNQYVQRSRVSDLANHRKVLGHFLRWCNAQGYMRTLPLMEIPIVKRRRRPILRPEQIQAMLNESRGSLLVFVSMYLYMGIRRSEILRLRWSSLDLDRGILVIQEETTRTRKGRAVPINTFVLELLRQRQAAFKSEGIRTPWVFPKRGALDEHRSETTIANPWHSMLKRAGLDNVKPHDLRATFEYYANKRSDFTDTQREKMAGAAIEVQRKHYVSFDADDVRGLESVVPMNPDFAADKLADELTTTQGPGKTRVSKNLSDRKITPSQKRKTK